MKAKKQDNIIAKENRKKHFATPEGFTTVVANEGLEKARAYLNQVPWDLVYHSSG